MKELIIAFVSWVIVGLGTFIKLWFSNERLKERVKDLEDGNQKIMKKFDEMSDKIGDLTATVARSTAHIEILLLSKLKTSNNR